MEEATLREYVIAYSLQFGVYALFAFVAFVIARALKFFEVPAGRDSRRLDIPELSHVVIGFGLYLTVLGIGVPVVAWSYAHWLGAPVSAIFTEQSRMRGLLSVGGSFSAAAVVVAYVLRWHGGRLRRLWTEGPGGFWRGLYDGAVGLGGLLVAYPVANAIGSVMALMVVLAFGVHDTEQLAVDFFRTTLHDPVLFPATVLMIVVAVPVVEECLFRMLLQSWLRTFLTVRGAIIMASLVFSAFHYATAQGVANIPLLMSLFFLSCFVGFVYERQRSLWAPVALHGGFNATSLVAILLFG